MKLFQAKTIGHRRLKDTGWYSMSRNLTVFEGRPGLGKTTLIRTLQSINPGSGETDLEPFRDYPREVEKSGYRRRIIPGKKTGVFAIFICNEKLRRQLTPIDPVFFETDRIEVGRRMDWSRWIIFVEIAASSRWSEVAPDLACLRDLLGQGMELPRLLKEYQNLEEIKPTARIKKELADRLNDWLDNAEPHLPEEGRKCLNRARFKVNRAARFQKARQVTAENLPVFVYFDDSGLITADPGRLSLFLGLQPEDLQVNELSGEKKEQVDLRLNELSSLVNTLTDDRDISLGIYNDEGTARLLVSEAQGKPGDLEESGAELVWLLSLLINLQNTADSRLEDTILLLDEPGSSWPRTQRELLNPVIEKLASRTQVIMTCQPGDPLYRENNANRFSLTDNNGRSELKKIS